MAGTVESDQYIDVAFRGRLIPGKGAKQGEPSYVETLHENLLVRPKLFEDFSSVDLIFSYSFVNRPPSRPCVERMLI